MTRVQHDSLPEILKGHDALVKAKTGTGKTVGFLVPSIEVLIREKARVRNDRNAPAPRILILSPTRELAQQIAAEAAALCTFHNLGITLLVGGTSMGGDVRSLNKVVEGNSDIIVATPGRMVGHLEETNGFSQQMKGVKVFVMDEADRLLDMGFSKDISKITGFLNHREAIHGKRQTLLFSATVSPEIQQIARSTLQHGYKFIDTVGEEVEQTHAHVPQQVVTVPLEQQMRAIVSILEEQKRINADYKMILFFPTARQTGYYAAILNSIGMKVLEIHSRKSQAQRTRTSEEFRAGRNVILLSSDVSARGMDYPDVSFVLQVGMTARDQYIHR
jgi:ATP-dependent RNA helicase MSS116